MFEGVYQGSQGRREKAVGHSVVEKNSEVTKRDGLVCSLAAVSRRTIGQLKLSGNPRL